MGTTAIDPDFFDKPGPTSRASRKAVARHERRTERKEKKAPTRPPLVALNEAQSDLIASLVTSGQVFAEGPAGVGKTYIAARIGLRMVMDGLKEKVAIARVTVTKKKHSLGFLPGTQDEKLAPWMIPVMDGFKAEASASTVEALMKSGKIECLSFETLRGRSLSNAFVILDEAQNCDLDDLKLFLTRIGEGSTVVVCGDSTQVDLPNVNDSGFKTVLDMIDDFDIPADIVEFGEEDVVRSETAKVWVRAFSRLK